MTKKVDVAIIGAGTSGLTAYREVIKKTDNFVMINSGPYGTTCARVGCMPSKVFIQIANDYHRRLKFQQMGIRGGGSLKVDIPAVLDRVRELRDGFVGGVMETMEKIGDKSISGHAEFIGQGVLLVNGELKIEAKSIIIAAGSSTVIPSPWKKFGDRILTSDNIFEQSDLPSSIGVIGTGVIGLELGLALSRLGISITAVNGVEFVGGLSDPDVNAYAVDVFRDEFQLRLNEMAELEAESSGFEIKLKDGTMKTQGILAAMGRRPNISGLKLENAGIELDDTGIPRFNPETMQVGEMPVYIAGDINGVRPVLHEAADEGRIAGHNAVGEKPEEIYRRVPLSITFSDPEIATVGKRFADLQGTEYIYGDVTFDQQGRSIVMGKNRGFLRIYGDPSDGKILGAEMIAPAAEHMAHLLALAIKQELKAADLLGMPVYHPTVEEGFRSAVRDVAKKTKGKKSGIDLVMCEGHPVKCLN